MKNAIPYTSARPRPAIVPPLQIPVVTASIPISLVPEDASLLKIMSNYYRGI